MSGRSAVTVGDYAAERSIAHSRRENAVPPKKGKNPRSGEISPVSVFKLPLGHRFRCDFP